jgi:predicted HicB family RNase H-like nuclease
LRIKPSLKAALERLARAEERTLNFYVERILEAHVAARRKRTGRPRR